MKEKSRGENFDVAIIGAGPTGLTLALCLELCGVKTVVFEKERKIPDTSRAIAVQARTLMLFESLGVVREFLSQGKRVDTVLVSQQRKKLCEIHLGQAHTCYPYMLILPQHITQEILLSFLKKNTVKWGEEVKNFSQEEDLVRIDVKSRGGDKKKISARFLVDCGGAHSLVRHRLAIPFKGKTYADEDFLLADVALSWKKRPEAFHAFISREGVFAAIALPGGTWRLLGQMPVGKHEKPLELTKSIFKQMLVERAGVHDAEIGDIRWMSQFRINKRMVKEYRRKSIFLAGDAAHIHSPFGGQGMNISIQDAYNLAWKLAFFLQGHAQDALLETYQAERAPAARRTLEMTDISTNLLTSGNYFARIVRSWFLSFILGSHLVQEKLIGALSELTVNYRQSIFSKTYAQYSILGGTLYPGDPAPEGEVHTMQNKKISLYSLLSPSMFTGLYFTPESDERKIRRMLTKFEALADQYRHIFKLYVVVKRGETSLSHPLLLKAAGSLFDIYDARPESFCLVRPDAYIAYLEPSFDNASLKSFFASSFFRL